jgi:membrane protein DedA with SNARE-associated domain
VVLPFAGFVASDGRASLPGMIAAATAGSMAGAWVLYGVAAAIGPLRFGRFVVRWGGWLGITDEDVRRAEAWFDRRGAAAVLLGRCVPLIRSLVSIPAGFRRMAIVPFTIYTLVGSLVWNAALIGAGYLLRDRWEQVEPYADYLQYAVVAVVVAVVARFVWRRVVKPRARSRGPRAGDPRSPAR